MAFRIYILLAISLAVFACGEGGEDRKQSTGTQGENDRKSNEGLDIDQEDDGLDIEDENNEGGDDANGEGTDPVTDGEKTALEGTWIAPGNGLVSSAAFTGASLLLSNPVMTEDGATHLFNHETRYNFTLVDGGDNTYAVDQVVSLTTWTLKDQDLVDYANVKEMCGVSQWNINTPAVITANECEFVDPGSKVKRTRDISVAGVTTYQTYKVDGEKLFYGVPAADKDGSSEEKRMDAIQDDKHYLKK